MVEFNNLPSALQQWVITAADGSSGDGAAARRSLSIRVSELYGDLCRTHAPEQAERLTLEKLGEPSWYTGQNEKKTAKIFLMVASVLLAILLLCDVHYALTHWNVMFTVNYLYHQTSMYLSTTATFVILEIVALWHYRRVTKE